MEEQKKEETPQQPLKTSPQQSAPQSPSTNTQAQNPSSQQPQSPQSSQGPLSQQTSTQQKPQFTQEPNYPSAQQFKRKIAFKHRIGSILSGSPILEDEKLRFLEINNKQIVRINLIANITDKFIQEGEKKFASITLDDASGQIKAKTFGDDIEKFTLLQQGDTVQLIGLLRHWNDEVYITPEIIKKRDPQYLLVRKLECDSLQPKSLPKPELQQLKDKILQSLKDAEKDSQQGLEIESLILDLKESPDIINAEIKKLLEEGMAYEPRPGKLRYLG